MRISYFKKMKVIKNENYRVKSDEIKHFNFAWM